MRDFAIVKSIDGQKIEVVSLISDACVICNNTSCAKKGKGFYVLNKKNIPLKENNIIRIGFPKLLDGILGLISLLFPIASSVAGFLLAPRLCSHFNYILNPSSQACIVGIFFVLSALFVFILSRTDIHLMRPEVIQVV